MKHFSDAIFEEFTELQNKENENIFPQSVLKHKDGSLIKFYHGTKNKFTKFDSTKAGLGGPLGIGMYFTSKPATSNKFGEIKTVYLDIKNPKMFKTKRQPRDFLIAMSKEYNISPQEVIQEKKSLPQKITELLKTNGYDGVVCYFSELSEVWCVVYESDQIKIIDWNKIMSVNKISYNI